MNRKNILPILLAASMVSGLFANTTFVQADEIEESEENKNIGKFVNFRYI